MTTQAPDAFRTDIHLENLTYTGIGDPQTANTRRWKVTSNVGATLRSIAPTYRRRIKTAYRELGLSTSLNDAGRSALANCIFDVENDLESRGGGQPYHPDVVVMRRVRNLLLDDCGENEARP
jgi:hypothetical protein